jgi:hypothetical protein
VRLDPSGDDTDGTPRRDVPRRRLIKRESAGNDAPCQVRRQIAWQRYDEQAPADGAPRASHSGDGNRVAFNKDRVSTDGHDLTTDVGEYLRLTRRAAHVRKPRRSRGIQQLPASRRENPALSPAKEQTLFSKQVALDDLLARLSNKNF